MSDNVVNDTSEWGIVKNVRVAVGIASPALSDQNLLLLSVSWPIINQILSSCHRPMSGDAGSAICKSGVVENVGVAVGVTLLSLSVQE